MSQWNRSDSDTEDEVGLNDDYRETLAPGRQNLGINRNYVGGWDASDAFREFYQNWVDGMVESFNLTRDQIRISVCSDTPTEYIVVAKSTTRDHLLGYIRFQEKTGNIELTNFSARLTRKALGLGVSSKRHSLADVAGKHGEGFKVGALLMVRKGFQVRYESSSYYWEFFLGGSPKDTLYCKFDPVKEQKPAADKRQKFIYLD
ncbi:hypothetical protein HYFRA_00008909 [Hymenoscyphus fraxineus]|uniref:Uncharacterized protein n=1 Tax=Hymenoscyphus fraxineus TaxID=746836 RepID=A0A9N9KVA7_9HELO|nr:hypothetical protein HYFRA_00008909 [Hymenoscyphus fraxineus]